MLGRSGKIVHLRIPLDLRNLLRISYKKCWLQKKTDNNQGNSSDWMRGPPCNRVSPYQKIGQNIHPCEIIFFLYYYQFWTKLRALKPFLPPQDPRGVVGGPLGVFGGSDTPKLPLSLGDPFSLQNVMQWVITTSYIMFFEILGQNGPTGVKRGCFGGK